MTQILVNTPVYDERSMSVRKVKTGVQISKHKLSIDNFNINKLVTFLHFLANAESPSTW